MKGLLTDTQRDLIALAGLVPILVHVVRLSRAFVTGRQHGHLELLDIFIRRRVRTALDSYNRESNGDITALIWVAGLAVAWTLLGTILGATASEWLLNFYAGISTLLVAAQYFAIIYIYWGFDGWFKGTAPTSTYQRFVVLSASAWIFTGIASLLFLRNAEYTLQAGPSKVGLAFQCMFAFLASLVVAAREIGKALRSVWRYVNGA
jgi:hypothetical protein